MLTLINTLTLATALTLQPISNEISVNISGNETTYDISISSTFTKESKYNYTFDLILFNEQQAYVIAFSSYNKTIEKTNNNKNTYKNIAIGYTKIQENQYDIAKYKEFNTTQTIESEYIGYSTSILKFTGNGEYNIDINIRSKNFMEELLTALTTAVQSAVSIFVEGFGGLTQIFYNGTEITFIGGILIVGLAVMFLMMFLRWIVSFVKGI